MCSQKKCRMIVHRNTANVTIDLIQSKYKARIADTNTDNSTVKTAYVGQSSLSWFLSWMLILNAYLWPLNFPQQLAQLCRAGIDRIPIPTLVSVLSIFGSRSSPLMHTDCWIRHRKDQSFREKTETGNQGTGDAQGKAVAKVKQEVEACRTKKGRKQNMINGKRTTMTSKPRCHYITLHDPHVISWHGGPQLSSCCWYHL